MKQDTEVHRLAMDARRALFQAERILGDRGIAGYGQRRENLELALRVVALDLAAIAAK